jgi:hypothetical protein
MSCNEIIFELYFAKLLKQKNAHCVVIFPDTVLWGWKVERIVLRWGYDLERSDLRQDSAGNSSPVLIHCRFLVYPMLEGREDSDARRITRCKIWGFHCGDSEEYRLLVCYAVWFLYEPVFRRNVPFTVISSQSLLVANYYYCCSSSAIFLTLMMEVIRSSETSVRTWVTRYNIPDESILQNVSRFKAQNIYCSPFEPVDI